MSQVLTPNSPTELKPPPKPGGSKSVQTVYDLESRFFRRAFQFSVVAHCALLLFSLVGGIIFPRKPKVYMPSVRVDLIGLPDLKKTDLKNADASADEVRKKLEEISAKDKELAKKQKQTEAKKAETAADDNAMKIRKKEKQAEKERKDSMQSAIDRIKALQAIENSVSKAQAPAKGNVLSEGSQLSGEQGTNTDVYVDGLVTKIRNQWKLPVWLSKQNLSAKVVVYLRSTGGIDRMNFVQPSGNESFDQYVKKAIESSAPFPPPPRDIESDGILLGFPL